MPAARTRVDLNGRIVIPAAYRRALGMEPGSELVVMLDDGELRLVPIAEAIRRAQEIVCRHVQPGRSMVDELIAQRRSEAGDG